jgi:hypothetical protein
VLELIGSTPPSSPAEGVADQAHESRQKSALSLIVPGVQLNARLPKAMAFFR